MASLSRRWSGWMAPLVLALTALAPGTGAPAAADAAPPPVQPGGFTAVTPARALDTRTGVGAPAAKVGGASVLELQVTGRGGVPGTGVSAVALNVTVTEPTNVGYLTVYPSGVTRPVASSLNFAAGQTVANAVVVKVGTGGKVSIYNSSGSSHLVADVAGWHASTGGVGTNFTSLAPTRIFDSRPGPPVGPGAAARVAVPVPGASAVALNVTATEPTAGGYLTVYPAGTTRPLASNLNFVPGQTRANSVVVKVAAGAVDVYNASGTTHVVVDLMGYWGADARGRLTSLTPTRILDTRTNGGSPLMEATRFLQLPGPATPLTGPLGPSALPLDHAEAVVLNVTVTQPTAGGYLAVFPAGYERPLASNLNFAAGETVPNLVVVPVGLNAGLNIYNSSGASHVIVDVVGWFDFAGDRLPVEGLSSDAAVVIDPTSTYAYVSNPGQDQVEVVRLADGALEEPIAVGDQPMGLDLSPDGARLYVANRGGASVSVVHVATRAELRRIPVPQVYEREGPFSVAVLANGKALLTTTYAGSQYDGRMFSLDLASETLTFRTDFHRAGMTTFATVVRASGDRQSASITDGGMYWSSVFRYDATTDTFTDRLPTGANTYDIAANDDGSVTLLNSGLFYDADLRLTGTVPSCGIGVALDAAGTRAYGLNYNGYTHSASIVYCDPVRYEMTDAFRIGPAEWGGRLALSPDGTTLVGITPTYIVLFEVVQP